MQQETVTYRIQDGLFVKKQRNNRKFCHVDRNMRNTGSASGTRSLQWVFHLMENHAVLCVDVELACISQVTVCTAQN